MGTQQRNNFAHTQVAWPRRWSRILAGFIADANGFFRSPLAGGGRDISLPPLEEMRYLAVHTGAVF